MVTKVKGSVAPDSSEVPYTGLESAEVTVEAVLDEILTGITSNPLHTRVVEIGVWNMDSTTNINVSHGLSTSQIRAMTVSIRRDTGEVYDFFDDDGAGTGFHTVSALSTTISLYRKIGGIFDDSGFDKILEEDGETDFNRGWIIIQYTD